MYLLKLLMLITTCHGQLAGFFPGIAKISSQVLDNVAHTSVISRSAQSSADLFASSLKSLLSIPDAVTRSYGVGNQLGILPNNPINTFGLIDNYLPSIPEGNEDATMHIRDLIPKNGYRVQEYEVATEDGYLLTMFRIPSNGTAVFLMHGLLDSSDGFVVTGKESGLAYLLANEGYDVWMGNARGNKHSRRHIEMKPTEAKFWDFSWHEIGTYDLPAMIDTVLDQTGARSLKYIGHSQGTTTFFVMASQRPEYNKKIALMIALSPIAFMSHVRSPVVRLLSPGTPYIHGLFKFLGIYELAPNSVVMRTISRLTCGGGGPVTDILCSNIMFAMGGVGLAQFNFTNLPIFMGHTPAGAAAKQLVHYGQGVITGDFKLFDYGTQGNLEKYGTEVPPHYPLEKISAPISLLYSDADWLAHPTDVDKLYNRLNSAVDIYKIPYHQFNHLDFLWAKDFKTLVYSRVRKLLAHFEKP